MDDNIIKVRASLVFCTGFGKDAGRRTAIVRIEDVASSLQIAEIELNPEQLMEFLSGGSARAETRWVRNPERVGKTMENKQVILGSSAFKNKEDANAGGEAWRIKEGWDAVEVRRNNQYEWVFVGRRWVAPTKEN